MLEFFIILIHILIFQSMFFAKNIMLHSKLNTNIRGKNKEAKLFTIFVVIFISASLILSFRETIFPYSFGIPDYIAIALSIAFMSISILIAGASLMHMKDSWRVGVVESEKIELITTGIYQFYRNPYFVSYIFVFAAYTIILQSYILFFLSIVGLILIHSMIIREEIYLANLHGSRYISYKNNVPRYISLTVSIQH